MRKFRSIIAGMLLLGGQLLVATSEVKALLPPPADWHSYYDNGWAVWDGPFATIGSTARLSYIPDCYGGPDGLRVAGPDEFNFSFRIGVDCVTDVQLGSGLVAASFTWKALDDSGQPVEFPCLNVRGTASTEDGLEGEIAFGVTSAGATSMMNRTTDQLTNVDQVNFALVLPSIIYSATIDPAGEELGAQNGYPSHYDIDISIGPCSSGWDGPNFDIEHYRRMAEQAEALPATL